MLTLEAHGKINLTLEILRKRNDGFHEIASVLQTISLHDTLTFEVADNINLLCQDPELAGDKNLAAKAAHLLAERTDSKVGATIKLTKRIPVAAGLGGGSSDAAATLLGLNKLWNLNQSREDLRTIAESIGSDVPFFLDGGVAIVSGRGEQVRQLPPTGVDWAVILTPPTQLYNKTAAVYGAVTPSNYSAGALTRKLGARIHSKGDIPPQLLFNAFDLVAQGVFPNLDRYWRIFEGVGAREIHVCGAGPSVFAPVSNQQYGTAIELMLRHQHGLVAHLVSFWSPQQGII